MREWVSGDFEKDYPKLAGLCIQEMNYYDGQSEEGKGRAFGEIVDYVYRGKANLLGALFMAHLIFRDGAEEQFRKAIPFEDRKEKALEILRVEGVNGGKRDALLMAFLGEDAKKILAAA